MTFSLADKSRDEDCDGDVDVIIDVDVVAAAPTPPTTIQTPSTPLLHAGDGATSIAVISALDGRTLVVT